MAQYFSTQYTACQQVMDAELIVGSGSYAYTDPFLIENADSLSVFISTTGGRPHLLITNEYSNSMVDPLDTDTFVARDSTGGLDIFADNYAAIEDTVDELILKTGIWARMKVSGIVNNSDITTCTITVCKKRKRIAG